MVVKGKDGMYHYLYKTTNSLNGRFYIGVHSTQDLNDGYLGSGKLLMKAVKKYGKSNFHKETIAFFESREDLYKEEFKVVTFDLVANRDCYNITVGGTGSKSYDSMCELEKKHRKKQLRRRPTWNKPIIEEIKSMVYNSCTYAGIARSLNSMHNSNLFTEYTVRNVCKEYGLTVSEEIDPRSSVNILKIKKLLMEGCTFKEASDRLSKDGVKVTPTILSRIVKEQGILQNNKVVKKNKEVLNQLVELWESTKDEKVVVDFINEGNYILSKKELYKIIKPIKINKGSKTPDLTSLKLVIGDMLYNNKGYTYICNYLRSVGKGISINKLKDFCEKHNLQINPDYLKNKVSVCKIARDDKLEQILKTGIESNLSYVKITKIICSHGVKISERTVRTILQEKGYKKEVKSIYDEDISKLIQLKLEQGLSYSKIVLYLKSIGIQSSIASVSLFSQKIKKGITTKK